MTGLLLPSDRLITDRGERVEARPKPPGRSRLARLLIAWPYIVPLLVLSVVYGRTVQRSTGNYFSVDTTKFDYLGLVLGTAHPPGYPLYTMLNAAFVRIVPWGSVALRANLLSAVFAILACLVAVAIFTKLGVRPIVAAGGASALGLIPQLWHFALIAEVYTLSILFVALVLASCLGTTVRGDRCGYVLGCSSSPSRLRMPRRRSCWFPGCCSISRFVVRPGCFAPGS